MPMRRKFCFAACLLTIASSLTANIDIAHAAGPFDARNGNECRAQLNAAYDAREAEMRAEGNARGIAWTEEQRREALDQCKALDRILLNERVSSSLPRLSSAMEALRNGRAPQEALTQAVDTDHTAILKMPSRSPYRDYYLKQYADYQRYLSLLPQITPSATSAIYRCSSPSKGLIFSDHPCSTGGNAQARPIVLKGPPGESCASLRKHAAESRQAYDSAVNALLAGAKQAGDGWRSSEARRQRAMSDLRWYTDRARLQRCNLP